MIRRGRFGARWSAAALLAATGALSADPVQAFPAILVAKGPVAPTVTEPRVVLVHEGTKFVLSFTAIVGKGGKDLAWILPVPSGVDAKDLRGSDVQEKNFNVGARAIVESLGRFTTPRLVVGRDENPCQAPVAPAPKAPAATSGDDGDQRIGYTYVVSAKDAPEFDAGDYDVKLLAAKESAQVVSWLGRQGYKLSGAARSALHKAAQAKRRFAFVRIKIAPGEGGALRPLQMAYESAAMTVPLSFGAQALAPTESLRLYLLSPSGRTDIDGMPTIRFPMGTVLPLEVKSDLGKVYEAILAHGATKTRPLATLEYAGDLGFCEPCVDEPPSVEALRELGVFWLNGVAAPKKDVRRGRPAVANPSGAVFLARWRLTWGAKERALQADPRLVDSGDRNEFHPRMAADEAHPAVESTCEGVADYATRVATRQRQAIANLAALTGWDAVKLERVLGKPQTSEKSWVDDLWK